MLNFIKIKVFNKKGIILLLLVWMMLGISASVYALCDYNIDPFCQEPDLPLDGGVGILIAAGALYGLKKIKDKNNQAL